MSRTSSKKPSVKMPQDERQETVVTGKKSENLRYREVFVFLGTFVFFLIFARLGIDPHHDGVMLIPAIRVAEGQVVFRDVFFQYGLLVPLLQGLAVFLFGGELLVIRMLTVLFYAGSAVLLDLLWRRFLPRKLSYFTPVLFCLLAACTMVTFHSWNSVYALFFMLLSGFFQLRYFEGKNLRQLFYAGIAAALTWASRTPCGMVTVFAAVLVVLGANWYTGKNWRQIMKEAGIYAAGAMVIALLALSYILITGGWEDFIKQNFGYVTSFVYERGSSGSWQYFSESLFPFIQEGYYFCNSFFAIMPLAAMTLLYFACRRGILDGKEAMREELPFIALLVLGLGSWHQYYPVPCVRHLFWGGAPLFGAYLLAMYRLWKEKNLLGKLGVFFLALVLLAAVGVRIFGMAARVCDSTRVERNVPGIRNIKLSRGEAALVDYVSGVNMVPKSRRPKGMQNWSEDSLFTLMLPDSGFRHKLYYRCLTDQYPDYDLKQLQFIQENRPWVLVDHDVELRGYTPHSEFEYLGKVYRILIPVY